MKNLLSYLMITFLLLGLSSCNQQEADEQVIRQIRITGRNREPSLQKPLIYTANIPLSWDFKEPAIDDSLTDTMKPICEIIFFDSNEQGTITIHNFPTESMEDRIPPEAQVARWKRQLAGNDATMTDIEQQAFGGFFGLRFEGIGELNGAPQMVIGWSMQIAPDHFYALSQEHEGVNTDERSQMRADYTIKVVGPPELLQRYKESLNRFARSFRLIKPIPNKR